MREKWDEGNREKNWLKHAVTTQEAEQLFFNRPLILSQDREHSQDEARYGAFGTTNAHRELFVVFTIRGTKIRVISARDQDKQERRFYEQSEKAA
jgi:uncharacterized DUF497 family protein